jgi:hypothetical protein
MNFIKETQNYVRQNIKVLTVSRQILPFLGRLSCACLFGQRFRHCQSYELLESLRD